MIIATTPYAPGHRITGLCGEVFGLTVRSRNIGAQMGASLKAIVGGELTGMTRQLYESRNEAINRLIEQAEERGANGIIAMRFDTSELGEMWTEVCAYGTAVTVVEDSSLLAAQSAPAAAMG